MSARVEPDPAHSAGHALIRVAGAAAAADRPGFRIQRDAGWGDDKLGPGGWQSSDALLQPDRAEAVGGDLVLHVGWPVCRHLEAGVFEISVPAAGVTQEGVYWPDIVPLHTGTSAALAPKEQPKAAPPVQAGPPAPKPPATPPPAIPPPTPAPSPVQKGTPQPTPGPDILKGAIFAACLGLLLLVAGVGTYYWRTSHPEAADIAATTAPPPAVGLSGLSVVDVLAQAPNAAAITAEGERRMQADKRDDGLLLLEAAADRADPGAAAALARLYDPVLFQPGGAIPRPDPRQAARYYRDAARGGADVAAARGALERNLQARAQAGDLGAGLSLKDFWP